MDPQLQQAQQQQPPIRMVYAHPHPQQASLPPLPVQSVRPQNTNNVMVMNQGNISSSTIANHNINHGLQSSSTLQQQQQHPIKQRVSPPTNMMMNNPTNSSTNSNTVNHNGILQTNPQQQVVMMATPSGNQPLVIDQVPILYQTSSPSLSQQSLPTQQVLIPNQQQQQQFHHSYNNQQQNQQNQQTNLYNNLQASNTLVYNSNSIPSVSPKFNTSPNSQPNIPFSATTTALNQSINNNLMSSQQESNYESWRPPSVSTTNLNNNNNNSNKKNSPPSPSPITKFANKVIDILTPNEKATYVNLSPENQPVSTQNVATNHKPKASVKGLSNPMGEYNCFLNVVIQSLWNLEIFRELFLSIDPKNHKHKSFESCVYCALQNLFTHFKYSENSILDPNLVRNSLSFAHNKDSKFQLKHMDDASEVFQAIIEDINNSLEYSQIPIFDFYVTDFYVCSKCNKFSDPHNYTTTNWCISSCEFVQKKRENPSVTFEGALRSTIESFHRTCESCKEISDSQKHIFQAFPAVTSFSFSWNRDVISEDDILEFMSYFKIKQIKLHEIFRLNCNGSDIEVMGHVSSIICYYGRHYICLVYNKKLESWFAIDDSNVRQIDADRLDDFIVSSKFQPCVVLVEVDSHKGNIKIENKMKEKTTTNEIELISPNKKRMATSDVFPSKNEESSPINESQFTVLDQHFGVIIEGFNAVTDFFYWNRKISKHADIYTRTITLTKDQIQNMNSQMNICIYLGTLELLENETVTVRLSCTQNQKNKTPPVVIGKLDNRKKSTFTSIPIGFLITENSKNYELNFYIKKEKIIQ